MSDEQVLGRLGDLEKNLVGTGVQLARDLKSVDERVTNIDQRVRRLEERLGGVLRGVWGGAFAVLVVLGGGIVLQQRTLGRVDGSVTQLLALGRTTFQRVEGLERTIRELHPNDQSIIDKNLVFRSPASGLVATMEPVLAADGWRATVALIDRTKLYRWDVKLENQHDRRISDLIATAASNPFVDAVNLETLRGQVALEQSPADPRQSFIVRGDIQICRDRLTEKLGKQSFSSTVVETQPATGGDFVHQLFKLPTDWWAKPAVRKPAA